MKTKAILGALGLALALMTGTASAVVTTQLGAALDESGSMGQANFTLELNGWANAIGNLPVDGSVEVTVVTFDSSAVVHVAPTVISSAAIRTAVVNQINAIAYTGGGTSIAAGITALANAMLASANYSAAADSIMNIATDGGSSITASIAAAMAAEAGGIDALTAEAVGGGANPANMDDWVFAPGCAVNTGCGTILATDSMPPNPMNGTAWVLPVSNFTAFGSAINAKVGAIVGPVPEPATALLMAIGIAGLGFTGRSRKKTA